MKKEATCWNLLFHIWVGGGMMEHTTAESWQRTSVRINGLFSTDPRHFNVVFHWSLLHEPSSCLAIFIVVVSVGKWYQRTTKNLGTWHFSFCYIPQELPVASFCECAYSWHLSKHSPDLSCPQGISNLCGLCLWIMKYIVIPQIKHIKLNDCFLYSFSLCELLTMYHPPWHLQYHRLTLNSEK